jgi:predicted TIM-barrel fold metal-dependent hydrolase
MLALGQPPLPEWTPARSIEEMDKSGIAISVVSLGSPVAVSPDAQFVRRLARDVNEYSAKMVKDHPGRFAFFSVLPLPDIDGSLREVEHCLGHAQSCRHRPDYQLWRQMAGRYSHLRPFGRNLTGAKQ